ncbi:MAG: sulfotransferase [Chloroflexi bacterium]|nr:sulfotransferase [Chloroflexota bacterium]
MPFQALRRSANRIKRQLVWEYRQATNRFRSLPHFVVIGAQKAGTTSLYYYLSQHPQIAPSFAKEVHYFDGGQKANSNNYENGVHWYRAHFPLTSRLGNRRMTGEASPIYIFHPQVAERIHQLMPNVKLIALLRNPTERAISHYFHQKRTGRETLPLDQALQEEDKRINPAIKRCDFGNDAFRRFSYKARGRYKEQLDRYFRYFSRDQLLILSSEEFFREPMATLDRVFEFLGIEEGIKSINLNPKNVAPNKSDIAPQVREYLDDYFASDNQALFELIGKEFDWRRGTV